MRFVEGRCENNQGWMCAVPRDAKALAALLWAALSHDVRFPSQFKARTPQHFNGLFPVYAVHSSPFTPPSFADLRRSLYGHCPGQQAIAQKGFARLNLESEVTDHICLTCLAITALIGARSMGYNNATSTL